MFAEKPTEAIGHLYDLDNLKKQASVELSPLADPLSYHDGSSLANSYPALAGILRGRVVIPSSYGTGVPRAFNPHAPVKVYIDPGLTKVPIEVDTSVFTKENIEEAVQTVKSAVPNADSLTTAALTFASLAAIQKKKPQLPQRFVRENATIAGDAVAKHVKSDSGFAEKKVTMNTNVTMPNYRVDRPILVDTHHVTPFTNIRTSLENDQPVVQRPVKRIRVDFELPKPMGTFTGYYHRIIRKDDLLILVYDHGAEPTSQLWFPTAAGPDEDPYDIPILVYDEVGQPDTMFLVQPTPARFTDICVEYSILAISKEKSAKEKTSVNSLRDSWNAPSGKDGGSYSRSIPDNPDAVV